MTCSLKQCCIGCYISGSGLDDVLIEAVLYWLLHQWEWPGWCVN